MSTQPVDPRSRPSRGTGELLVTGATGGVGRALCAALGERKIRFRALIRASSDRSALEGSGGWLIEGDITRPDSLVEPLSGVRVVVHLAGVVRAKDPRDYDRVNAQGTEHLVAAARQAGVERVVLLSSDTVARATRDAYAKSKAEAEAVALAAAKEGGPACIVLRAPMILGPHGRHLRSLKQLSRLPALPVPRGSARRRPVWVGDVAAALVAAVDLDAERLPDGPVDLQGADPMTAGELVQAVARASGRRPPRLLPLPLGSLRAAAGLLEQLGFAAPLSRAALASIGDELPYDGAAALELLGWAPRPVEETLGLCLNRR